MWIADGTVKRQRDHSSDAGDRLEITACRIIRCDVAHLPVKCGNLLSQSLGNVDERLQISKLERCSAKGDQCRRQSDLDWISGVVSGRFAVCDIRQVAK